MQTVSLLDLGALAGWGFTLFLRAAAVVTSFVQPVLRRRAARRNEQPGVTIVIPVKALEIELEAAFASVFSQAYPQFEVLVTAAEDDSPAIEAARRVAARYPHVPARVLTGNKCFTLNPKVSNLAPAIDAASHDLILIKDANIHLIDGQIAELVRNLTPGIGMVCAVPIGVRPASFWSTVEGALMNGYAAPHLMVASVARRDVGFGKVMLFSRRDFKRVDGIAVMTDTFGDDHALAKALTRAGLRTVFAASVIRQMLGARSLRDVWTRQLRWMTIRRDEEPLAFYLEPLASGYFATLMAALAAPALGWAPWSAALATVVLWLTTEALVVIGRGWGWSWQYPFAALCREPLLLALWLRAWTARKVQWAGDTFDLSRPAL